MRAPSTPTKETDWPGALAFGLGLLAGGLAILAAADWSFGFELGPVRVSLRRALNPAIAASLFFIFGAWWLGRARADALFCATDEWMRARAALAAAALSLFVLAAGVNWGAFIAGGADSSGYLNQARLWAGASLHLPPRPLPGVAFSEGIRALTPVGFRPGADGTIVPLYPPGLPIAMALVARVAGEGAQFVVTPLAAAVLSWAAFVFGRRLAGAWVGLLGAAATAASPTMVYQALQPMSDVPAAAAWLVGLALLASPSIAAALGAGLAAAAGCLIRPNLFAMIPMLLCAAWWWSASRTGAVLRTAIVLMPALAAGLAFAWWQRQMYGAVAETGYGAAGTLFSLVHVGPNVVAYGRWLFESHGVLVFLGVAGPFALQRGGGAPEIPRSRAITIAWWSVAMCAALFAFYVLYLPFDSWTYTRFLLPVLPLAFVLAAVVVIAVLDLVPPFVRIPAKMLAIVAVLCFGWGRARDAHATRLWDNERRYVEVAEFAEARAPAAFLAMQHSGSLIYYTNLPIVRWDWVSRDEIDRRIDEIATSGHAVYAVLDDWEVSAVRSRFAGTALATALQAPVFRSRERPAIAAFVFLVQPAAPVSGK